MTTDQIIALSRTKLLESTEEILSTETLLLYANLTYIDIWRRIFINSDITTATVSFTTGVGTLNSDFGTLYGKPLDSSNNSFEEVTIDDFDQENLNRMVTIEGGVIKVFPADTASLTIKYYTKPQDLSAAQNPTIDDYFHEVIVYGIMARALEDLQDEDLSKYYMEKYENELVRRMAHQSNYEEANQRGGVMFAPQGLISDNSNYFI
jgi:hypothetical protein